MLSRSLRVLNSQRLVRTMSGSEGETVFHKIVRGEIPCTKVFENDHVLAFRDISPTAPTHVVVIPKVMDGLSGLSKAEDRHKDILGELLLGAKEAAKVDGLDKTGYRIVINDGKHGCQSVDYIHVHVIGGQQLTWPPGTGKPEGSMTG